RRGFRMGGKPLAQEVGASEDGDVEIGVEFFEANPVSAAIQEMPERHLPGVRRNSMQGALTDQVVASVADVAQFLEKLVFRLRLPLPLGVGNGHPAGAVGKPRIVTGNTRHEASSTHSA